MERRRQLHGIDRHLHGVFVVKTLAALMMFAASSAAAQPFVEFGLGAPTGGCIYRYYKTSESDPVCSEKPLGLVAVGWKLPHGFAVQYEHWSSLATTKDRGVELLSLRWRYTFGPTKEKEDVR